MHTIQNRFIEWKAPSALRMSTPMMPKGTQKPHMQMESKTCHCWEPATARHHHQPLLAKARLGPKRQKPHRLKHSVPRCDSARVMLSERAPSTKFQTHHR